MRFFKQVMAMLIAINLSFSATLIGQEQQSIPSKSSDPAQSEQKDKKANKKEKKEKEVGSGVNWYSIEKEIQIGKALAQQVEAQSKMLDDPVITEFVNRVGQNLVRNSDAKVPFTIKVIDSNEVNAFALPGGFFFINTGIILEADEEAEMAGVMAHEIAHVAARHGTRQATRGEIANLLSLPLIFLGGWAGYGARQAAGLIIPVGFMKFSRSFEREADELGLKYMYAAGYDPTAFITFFEKIQAKEKRKPGTLAKIFASHPQTPERIKIIQEDITRLPARAENIITTSEFDQTKERLESIYGQRGVQKRDPDRPTLRKTTTATAESTDDEKDKEKKKKEEEKKDERPTLKRRDQNP